MLRLRSYLFLSTSLVIAGCSIHPLPKDVTRDTTFSIIKKIRCEARDALITQVLRQLSKSKIQTTRNLVNRINSGELSFLDSKYISSKINNIESDIIYRFDTRRNSPHNIDKKELIQYWKGLVPLDRWQGMVDTETITKINKFEWSTISYKFTFTITENNNKTANASLKMPFTRGIFTLGLKAGSEKSRANERVIDIADPFGELLRGLDCEFDHRPRKHWRYPITGKIGLEEVVGTWIDLRNSEPTSVGSFSDQLTFITKFLGQVKPQVTINDPTPLKLKKFRLASADIDANADRKDQHKLLITLTFIAKDPSVPTSYKEVKLADGVILKIEKPSGQPEFSFSPSSYGILPSTSTQNNLLRQKGLDELNRIESLKIQRDLKIIQQDFNEISGR